MTVSKNHPRYESLQIRELIEAGVEKGITSSAGLIAHGRGEALDYLLGEKTHDFAKDAIVAAADMLLSAQNPVISVNGNAAALVGKELVQLAALLYCPLEINLFHESPIREKKIREYLISLGAKNVLLPQKTSIMQFISSNRKYVHPEGITKSDVVFVPLEDGDRAAALIKNGKKVITVDLNPLSRTAQKASITIVDNIVRVMPLLISQLKNPKIPNHPNVPYNNKQVLRQAEKSLRSII